MVIFALGSTNSSVFKILWEELRPFQVSISHTRSPRLFVGCPVFKNSNIPRVQRFAVGIKFSLIDTNKYGSTSLSTVKRDLGTSHTNVIVSQ